MPRPRNPHLKPRCHKGAAVVDIYDGGKRRTVTLGPWGSRQADIEFARILTEQRVGGTPAVVHGNRITVNELLLAFLRFADGHFVRADGTHTHEVSQYKLVARYVRETHGHIPAVEFGPIALKAIRQKFIDVGWCRSLVNQRVNRIRRMFRFAVAEELVPPATLDALTAVPGLQRGRSKVRETEPVKPVADEQVEAVLPYLTRHVRGLIELQRLTGCRPGEACSVRRADLEMDGPIWLYRPHQHKNSHRGKPRVIPIGPKAQLLLREFFTPVPDDYLFSPRRAVEEQHAQRSAARKTPRYPSHMARNARKRSAARHTPTEMYNGTSFGHAIAKACDKAFPPPAKLARREGESAAAWQARLTAAEQAQLKAWHKAHRWHPNQLRHSYATRVRKEHGLEAAQVSLGHSKADVTQVYAERNLDLAVSVAAKIG